MKFKIQGKEYIVVSADKFNEMKRLINEIYSGILVELEQKKELKNDNR